MRLTYRTVCKYLAARRCLEAGVPVKTIAKQAGVSISTIYRWLSIGGACQEERYRLMPPPPPLREQEEDHAGPGNRLQAGS